MTYSTRFGIAGAVLAFILSFFVLAGTASAFRAYNPYTFTVSEATGTAPLTVTFSASGASFTAIDFGEGALEYAPVYSPCTTDVTPCNVWRPMHTYVHPGQYVVNLMNGGTVVGTLIIKVSSTTETPNYLSASPTYGGAPLTVTFSVQGLGNNTIDFGDGQTGSLQVQSGSIAPAMWSTTHTYTAAGSYTAKVRYSPGPNDANCAGDDCWLRGTAVITVTSGGSTWSSLVFSADPAWGYAPLVVNFSASGGSYTSIDYGDGYTEYAPQFAPCLVGGISCNVWRPSHTYNASGFYQVKLNNGSQAVAVAGVNVRAALTPPVVTPPPTATCPFIQRRLSRGSVGSDVAALQNYFIAIGVLGSTRATGYFGPLTEGALQEWQESRGIISYGSPATTGWGATGPLTRSALARCGL